MKLTKAAVEALQAGRSRYVVWDAEIKGFGIRLLPVSQKRPEGGRIAVFKYRLRGAGRLGVPRWYTIGEISPGLTVAQARDRAEELRAAVTNGQDPARDEKVTAGQVIDGEKKAKVQTFKALADLWLAEKKKKRSYDELERIVENTFAELHKRSVAGLPPADLENLIKRIESRAPVMAFNALGVLRQIMAFGVKKKWLPENPAAHIEVDHGMPDEGRDVLLSDSELRYAWRAAAEMAYPYGSAVKLLILTLRRRSEVMKADWSELNFQKRTWELPAARSKNAKSHLLHMTPQVIEVLMSLPAVQNGKPPKAGLMFTTTGDNAISGLSKYKRKLNEKMLKLMREDDPKAKLPGWRLHDLRRSGVTALRDMGFPADVTELLLNHRSGVKTGIRAIYDKSDLLEQRKAAITAWSERVAAAVEGRPVQDNVIDLVRSA